MINTAYSYKTIQVSTWVATALLVSVAALTLPFTVNAETQTASTTINSNIGSVIGSVSGAGPVSLPVTPDVAGVGRMTIAKDTVTVSTNSSSGYTLLISAATPALTSGGNTIAAHSATAASPSALVVNSWGYRVVNGSGFGAAATGPLASQPISDLTFAGPTTTPVSVKSTSTVATSDPTDVWYGVAANTSKPSGNYSTTVTYTVNTN